MKFSGLTLTTALYAAMALVILGLGSYSALVGRGKATEAAPIAPANGAVTAGIEHSPLPDAAPVTESVVVEEAPEITAEIRKLKQLVELLGKQNTDMHEQLGLYGRRNSNDFHWNGNEAGSHRRNLVICHLADNKVTGFGWKSLDFTTSYRVYQKWFGDYQHPTIQELVTHLGLSDEYQVFACSFDPGYYGGATHIVVMATIRSTGEPLEMLAYTHDKLTRETVDPVTNQKVNGAYNPELLGRAQVVMVHAGTNLETEQLSINRLRDVRYLRGLSFMELTRP